MALLEVRGLTKYFGGLAAVSQLDFDVNKGEILGIIGPNGAGKTTVFNLITGFHRPTSGKLIFKGYDITRLKPNHIAQRGLVRTYQASTLFKSKNVLENIMMGHHLQQRAGFFSLLFNTHSARREEGRIKQQSIEISKFLGLDHVKDELPTNLPHGLQRILGVAIVLSTNPELMLLDEPVTGMNVQETMIMMDRVQQIRDRGVTIVLVEHDMKAVMSVCDRVVVLNFGRKIAEGVPEKVRENKDVIEAYLGSEESS
jgi:branched-chain amino acid transport system ATP-binding protein